MTLHYNWHRFYDPAIGRYISADPIGLAGGMNLYAYANQNPINYIDPEGLFYFDPHHDYKTGEKHKSGRVFNAPSDCEWRCLADKTAMLVPPLGMLPFDIDYLSYRGGYVSSKTSSGTADVVAAGTEIYSTKMNTISKVIKVAKPIAKASGILTIPANVWDYSADLLECEERCNKCEE